MRPRRGATVALIRHFHTLRAFPHADHGASPASVVVRDTSRVAIRGAPTRAVDTWQLNK